MKTSSCKAKGRRAAAEARDMLLELLPLLKEDDIKVVPSGVPGEDLWLSPTARFFLPFTFELKNVEKLNIWDALAQSETHAKDTPHTPLLVFRRNRSEMYVCLKFSDFLKLRDQS